MNLDRNNIKKILFIITFTLVLALCLFNIPTVLYYLNILIAVATPFIIGCAMAFIVNIPMNIIERNILKVKYIKKISRPLSLIFSIAFIIGIIAVVIGIVLPDLYSTILSVSGNITKFIPKLYRFAIKYIDNDEIKNYLLNLQQVNWFDVLSDYMKVFTSGAQNVITTTMSMISSVMNTTINILIAAVFCIYILLQKEELGYNLKKVLKAFMNEKTYNKTISLGEKTNNTFTNYVTGQCLDAFILGIMFFIVLVITGMPYSLLISVLVGFTALIPLVGAFIGCVISMFLLFMVSPAKSIIFLVIFLILQQVDENFVYPKVVGNSVGLPSIWVLVAVTIGGSLWGVLGMIVFIPLFSVIYTEFRDYVNKRLANINR